MFKMKNKIILIVLILLIMPIINAEIQTLGVFKQNDCVMLKQGCSNCTFTNITSVVYPNSSTAIEIKEMSKSGTEYSYNFCNTSLIGEYIVNGISDVDGVITVWAYDFDVTPTGESLNTATPVFYFVGIGVLIIFLILSIYSFVKFDNLLNRVGMIGLCYIFLTAIVFIVWNMTQNFLATSSYLIDMMRTLFFVLMAGAFPLLVGGFAWYVIMIFRIKEIQRLMDKGFTEDEAQRRIKNK